MSSAGKLDKKKLPPVGSGDTGEEGLPSTPTERKLAQLWCEILNITAVDVQESFFDLGGYVVTQLQLSFLGHRLQIRVGNICKWEVVFVFTVLTPLPLLQFKVQF